VELRVVRDQAVQQIRPFTLDDALAEAVALGASDLHVKLGTIPRVRIEGELIDLQGFGPLTREELDAIAATVMHSPLKRERLEQDGSADLSYELPVARFRVSVFRQRGAASYIFRTIPDAPDAFELGLPEVILTWAGARHGLVIVTGPAGSGKSTTTAALIRRINEARSCHIVTVEDPVEFIHRDSRALISQREIGFDAPSFPLALHAALRQDPDVILIGEIRDEETAMTALRAAETGHLVFCTMHTSGAADTVQRLMELFAGRGSQLGRQMLAASLVGIVSQRLVRGGDGRRRLNAEVLVNTARIRDLLNSSASTELIQQAIAEGEYYGMQTFDQSLIELVLAGEVDRAEAMAVAVNPHNLRLELDAAEGGEQGFGNGLKPKS